MARRRAALTLLVFLGTLVLSSPSIGADDHREKQLAVFPILANTASGQQWGYGFLVNSSTGDGLMLVTALHVVQKARSVEVHRMPGDHVPASVFQVMDAEGHNHTRPIPPTVDIFSSGTRVKAWPALDIAAILIPPGAPVARFALANGFLISTIDPKPAIKDRIWIFAQTDYKDDPEYPIRTFGGNTLITMGEHADAVAARSGERTAAQILGSVDRNTRILAYTIPNMAGMSGAPVAENEQGVPRVLAVHAGGVTGSPPAGRFATVGTAWAICAGSIVTDPAVSSTLGNDASWPEFATPDLRQGDGKYYDAALRKKALDDSENRVFLGAAAQSTVSERGRTFYGAAIDLTIDAKKWNGLDATMLGVRLLASYRTGDYQLRRQLQSVHGGAYDVAVETCLPSSLCGEHLSLRVGLSPIGFGYMRGTDVAGPRDIGAIRHGLWLSGEARIGGHRLVLMGTASEEIGLDFHHTLAPYTAFFGGALAYEYRVKDWNYWLKDSRE